MTANNRKRLYILRHAKAANNSPDGEDHSRPLTVKGHTQCERLAAYFNQYKPLVERVIISSSARTLETWERIKDGLNSSPALKQEESLYLASANEIINIIDELAQESESLMVIGHNPGLHELAIKLTKGGDEELINRLYESFPTAALATIRFDSQDWSEIVSDKGQLEAFILPGDM